MKNFISTLILLLTITMFVGCVGQNPEDTTEDVSEDVSESDYPPKTIEVTSDGETITITPEWLQMDNGACVARDLETGIIYAGNEVGEYHPHIPDAVVIEDLSEFDLPETFTTVDTGETITPVWLQLGNNTIARDPETGMLYASNEIGDYAKYLPYWSRCE